MKKTLLSMTLTTLLVAAGAATAIEQRPILTLEVAKKMAAGIEKAGNDVVAGDCTLANTSIVQETGKQPVHPIQLIARAYGISKE